MKENKLTTEVTVERDKNKRPTAVVVERGNYFLGWHTKNADGSTKKNQPPKWEPDIDGGCVIICTYDLEKNEPVGSADLFAHYDSDRIGSHIREKLDIERANFPTPAEIYKWCKNSDDDIDFCRDICEGVYGGYDCRVCPMEDIKAEDDNV
jgi:hypothetical protein